MDTYAIKFQSMQHFVPFLNKMITKLEKAGDRDKEAQLVKMKSLHAILTDANKKVRFETLLKCEEVLQKLYEKVEGLPASDSRSTVGQDRAMTNQSLSRSSFFASEISGSGHRTGGELSNAGFSETGKSGHFQLSSSLSSFLQTVHERQHYEEGGHSFNATNRYSAEEQRTTGQTPRGSTGWHVGGSDRQPGGPGSRRASNASNMNWQQQEWHQQSTVWDSGGGHRNSFTGQGRRPREEDVTSTRVSSAERTPLQGGDSRQGESPPFRRGLFGDTRHRVASVSPMPSLVAARSSLRNAALRLADTVQQHSGSHNTPMSPEGGGAAPDDVSFPFDELGIGEPRPIPLEPKGFHVRSLPRHTTTPEGKTIPTEPKSIPLESKYPKVSGQSTGPKAIPLERSGGSAAFYSRAIREAADSPQERKDSSTPAPPPPVVKSRWTPLIVTPESPPPPVKAMKDSPASPDTQTVSPQACSPDTQSASSPSSSSIFSSVLRRMEGGPSPSTSSQQLAADTPISPDTVSSPGQHNIVSKSTRSPMDIPNIPVNSRLSAPVATSLPSSVKSIVPTPAVKRADPRLIRGDPRARPKTTDPVPSLSSSTSLRKTDPTALPAYMSSIVQQPRVPPLIPMQLQQQPPTRIPAASQQPPPGVGQKLSLAEWTARRQQQQAGNSGQDTLARTSVLGAHPSILGRPFATANSNLGNQQRLGHVSSGNFQPSGHPQSSEQRSSSSMGSSTRVGEFGLQGPRNYREYRMMKEELERRRREQEERYQTEMQRRKEKEQQQLQLQLQPNKSTGSDEVANEEDKNVDEAASLSAENVKKETKGSVREAKAPEAKITGEKDYSRKPLNQAEEKKALEQVKSFKIPKMKKAEVPPPTKVAENENSTLKAEDASRITEEHKSEDKAKGAAGGGEELKEKPKPTQPLRKTLPRKLEKYITKDDLSGGSRKDSKDALPAGQSPATAAEKEPVAAKAAAPSEDSDSDQGALTIAEDHDNPQLSSPGIASEKVPLATTSADKGKESEQLPAGDQLKDGNDEQVRREELTKELLKNIVASLDPAEARKLILKAQGLEKIENFTLRELKEFLSVPSEKKAKKKKKKTKAEVTPEKPPLTVESRPATRRSGRLRTEVIPQREGALADSDSDVETFVIEPKEMKRKKQRRKAKDHVQEAAKEERNLQDSAITSSNIEENSNCSGESNCLPTELSVVIKTEPVEPPEAVEEAAELTSPRLLRTRAKAAISNTKAPVLPKKTKTWYPGPVKMEPKRNSLLVISDINLEPADAVDGSESKTEAASSASILKKEPLPDPDPAVFTGQGPVANPDFGADGFDYNSGAVDEAQAAAIRQRHARVSDIFMKLKLRSQEEALQRRPSPLPVTPGLKPDRPTTAMMTAPPACALPSKVRLSRPPLDWAGRQLSPAALVAALELKPPEQLVSAQARLIGQLARTVHCNKKEEEAAADAEEILAVPQSPPGLLRLVKEIRLSEAARAARSQLPALLPIGKGEEEVRQLPLRQLQLVQRSSFSDTKTFCQASLAEFKSPQALASLLDANDRGRPLFKCMSYSCAFSSQDSAQFSHHLTGHAADDKIGSLRCCYCLRKATDSRKLIRHVISKHGNDALECCYCFTRASTQLEMLLHLSTLHPEKQRAFVSCMFLPAAATAAQSRQQPHQLSCPSRSCSFTCDTDQAALLVQHFSDDCKELQRSSLLRQYLCNSCSFADTEFIPLILHQALMHHGSQPEVLLRQTDLLAHLDSSDEGETSAVEDSSDEVTTDSEMSEFDKNFYDDDIDELENIENQPAPEECGFSGNALFRCGNPDCDFSGGSMSSFKDHVLVCELSVESLYYTCFHCSKQFKHAPTLMEHLRTHAVKRYLCALCDYKGSVLQVVKSHVKLHKVSSTKLVPLHPNRTNPDEDSFIVVPKNALAKGLPAATTAPATPSKAKTGVQQQRDNYQPEEVGQVPLKPDIYRQLMRCGACDFATKVRVNLIKHLNLHLVRSKLVAEGALEEVVLPLLNPVNPPPVEFSPESNYSRMKSLLAADVEEELVRQPMSDADMDQMPKLIPENLRYACSYKDCSYITIDEVMLLYHMNALHHDMTSYKCPHCLDKTVQLEDLSLHLKCHGEMLFKCGHCLFYHWQKRTAEKHVTERHPDRKQFVRNVRDEEETKKELKRKGKRKEEVKKKEAELKVEEPKAAVYEPFKCGICDHSTETLAEILEHCRSVHELVKRMKCGICAFTADLKEAMLDHHASRHKNCTPAILRAYQVDPTSAAAEVVEDERKPLWSRDLEGLRHIRGILYEETDYKMKPTKPPPAKKPKREKFELVNNGPSPVVGKVVAAPATASRDQSPAQDTSTKKKAPKIKKPSLDLYAMACKACGMEKQTVSGLKMHIKVLHLHLGRFQCRHCSFTANLKKSIGGHYKANHPESVRQLETGETAYDYEEVKVTDPGNYPEPWWLEHWNIPTQLTRKKLLLEFNPEKLPPKRKSDAASGDSAKKVKAEMRRGRKRRPEGEEGDGDLFKILKVEGGAEEEGALAAVKEEPPEVAEEEPVPVSDMSRLEMSPFEGAKSYMCAFCPKRSQMLERVRRHHTEHHPRLGFEYRELTRDQVVSIITSDHFQHGPENEYKCFYCQQTGDIINLRDHTMAAHEGQALKVTKFQNKGVSGYLECRLCGHLTPGLERSLQKMHYHEEHPLEGELACSKYMTRTRLGPDAFTNPHQAFKFDVREVEGMTFTCPKTETGECNFDTKVLSQMTSHLRKHTRTYKCGHCGKTLLDSSEFHRHSALSHGDKIPDLVKDPEAEAEYEALKGLLEWRIQQKQAEDRAKIINQSAFLHKMTARKSTGADCSARPGDRCRNVASKSTGPNAKYWPETRISAPYSFYGQPAHQYDPRQIKTKMATGGMEITLDVEKMGQLLNLQPKLIVKDCVKVSINRDELDL